METSVIKFILETFRPHKKETAIIIIVFTISSLLAALVPYVYGKLFDAAIDKITPINFLAFLIVLWLSISLISDFISTKTEAKGAVLGYKIATEVEADLCGHYLLLPIIFHKKKRKGEFLQKISKGAWQFEHLTRYAFEILPRFIILIFSLVAMLLIKWQLALVLIFFFVVYLVLTLTSVKPIIKTTKKMHEIWEKQYGSVYDKLYNVFLVKNFAMEEKEKEKIKRDLLNKTIPTYEKMRFGWRNLTMGQRIIYTAAFISVLSLATFFLRADMLTAGEFIMFFGYISLAFGPFWMISEFYSVFKESSVALKRIKKLRDMVPETMKHGNKKLKEVKGNVSFENVSFGYLKNKFVIKNISFDVKAGENVAIVGESGVGKTTLAELVIGYYKLNKGTIFLDNVDISKLDLKWLRKQIAIVPQEISLFNDSIENNLRYANPKATYVEMVEACKKAFAHEFIVKLPKGYKSLVGERGVKLSVGQKQRLAIAMAFLKNPKILILDEPTAALDAISEKQVQIGIKNLLKNRTTFIIAHRLSTIREADKIVVLHKGKIVEIGNHKELIKKKGIYYKFYTSQKGVER